MIGAVRVGNTVRKPAGPWTPTIQALLRHLRTTGFEYAPEPLGVDGAGREMVAFIEGSSRSEATSAGWQTTGTSLFAVPDARLLDRTLALYVQVTVNWGF